jgi:hypothetical protein
MFDTGGRMVVAAALEDKYLFKLTKPGPLDKVRVNWLYRRQMP